MRNIEVSSRLSFLTPTHLEALNKRFAREGQRVMPHVLAVDLGLTPAHGLALITILHHEAAAEVFLAVYHNCEPDLVAGYLPFGQGFPDLPWPCPICERDVIAKAEILIDIECRTENSLFFS